MSAVRSGNAAAIDAVSAPADDRFAEIWTLLADVPDPEIPVVSVLDLGIVRDVRDEGGRLVVDVTPTYLGCPATEVIANSIAEQLSRHGHADVQVRLVLSPAWTTDWISDAGRDKLRAFGIAPPPLGASLPGLRGPALPVACPRCNSLSTTRISEFGSTPCKAAYRCDACLEPFDHFKCI